MYSTIINHAFLFQNTVLNTWILSETAFTLMQVFYDTIKCAFILSILGSRCPVI